MRNFPTGALLNKPDYRNIPAEAVLPPYTSDPYRIFTDMSKIPHWDQGAHGSCVPHARWKAYQALHFFQTGILLDLEPGFAYALDKQADGYAGEGTYPSVDDKNASTYGCATKDILTLDPYSPAETYKGFARTPELAQNAIKNKQQLPYLTVQPNIQALKQALQNCKLVTFSLRCGPEWFAGNSPLPLPEKKDENHRIILHGIETIMLGMTRGYLFNSWGEKWGQNGNGWIILEEYLNAGACNDIRAYYDVPQAILDEVKRLPAEPTYAFNGPTALGQSGEEVKALQDCLKSLGYFPITQISTGFYGSMTMAAVLKFQIFFGIQDFLSLIGLGGGRVGPLTLAALNKIFNKYTASGSKIDAWIRAITRMEGAKPSLHNPGDLKFAGQPLAIGKDSRGFAIFATEEDGITTLRNMLTNAVSGRSTRYPQWLTLRQFYAGITVKGVDYGGYAPSNDGNQPDHYAQVVADEIGVTPDTQIKDLA